MGRAILEKALREHDVDSLVQILWNVKLTKMQVEIVRLIAFAEHKRVVISAMTRYGKSYSVALGVCLYILFNKNKRILLIGPRQIQTLIIRNYIADNIVACDVMIKLLEIDIKGAGRIKREVSRSRITFKNGCELLTLSAEGSAERLMGFGGDLVIEDETCLISYAVYRQKISRMLGDNPDSVYISIGNPWHKDNHMWEHWNNEDYYQVHIGWKTALEENRITQAFLDEQKDKLTDREFRILYEAMFPIASEDVLIPRELIDDSLNKDLGTFNESKLVMGVDVARYGTDKTVITIIREWNGLYKQEYTEEWSEKPLTFVYGRIISLDDEWKLDEIRIDDLGLGGGVTDMLKNTNKSHKIVPFIASSNEGFTDDDKIRFPNWKSKSYIHLSKLFKRQMISLKHSHEQNLELSLLRIEYDNKGRSKILDFPKERDPVEGEKKSPNYADALSIACSEYKSSKSGGVEFVSW